MTVLVQLSDPHFGTERPGVVQALREWVHAQSPDVLVLSGDITQRATRRQFASARAFMDSLAVPHSLVIPGNHDIPLFALWTRVLSPYGRYRQAFGPDLRPTLDLPGCLVLGLNTTRWWRHKDGQISRDQVERIAARLRRASPAQLRVVVVHQPVAVIRPEDRANLQHGHARAIARWAEAGADLILGGHIHLPYALQLPTPRPLWAVQAGTALSRRVRSGTPNSVNLIRGPVMGANGSRHCTLERWDYAAASSAFEQAETRTLTLAPLSTSA